MRNLIQFMKDFVVPQSKKEWTISLISITVRNLTVMKKFYTQILGLSVLQEFDNEVLIGHGRGSIPLFKLVQGNGDSDSFLTTYSIGFRLSKSSQIGELINRFIMEEQTIMGSGFDGYTTNFYIMDPEGNRLKFMVVEDNPSKDIDQYLEGNEMKRSLHDFIDGIDGASEEFPVSARITQLHYNVIDVEVTTDFLINNFSFNTTYDYVTKRKNFKVNRDGYSIAINSWNETNKKSKNIYGLSMVEWRVPNMKELENLVLHLEMNQVPFHYYDAYLKVPTKDGIEYCFKVGDHS
ncbi:VOC family protein [uncultured Granulicatella sp.]|uniref:VOC family protein n=1 Tax=uncultured Granulicatella sp. TaxID=316089 RepID=UPI002628E319|nr:VOC family protein [uncultured Granulicatella sp.]